MHEISMGAMRGGATYLEAESRRAGQRVGVYVVPTLEVLGVVALFGVTDTLDHMAYAGRLTLPAWLAVGDAAAARQIVTVITAAIVTLVGIFCSSAVAAMTLSSVQFGPRMLRTLIRGRGSQVTMGAFLATFFYAAMVLLSIGSGRHGDFVPHLSVAVTLGLTVLDLAALVYFIGHVASVIQLSQVVAVIADDLARAIDAQTRATVVATIAVPARGPSVEELLDRITHSGVVIKARSSGYVQAVRHEALVRIATEVRAVIFLPNRPGRFLVKGHALALVWPPEAAMQVAASLHQGRMTGPARTLSQDISWGVDQLVEIALKALFVKDTRTALTCVDWMTDCLCRIPDEWPRRRVHRDRQGQIRLIFYQPDYGALVERAFEKIRQAGSGNPAVLIRLLDGLSVLMEAATTPERRRTLLDQAAMVQRANLETVPEEADRDDVRRRYEELLRIHAGKAAEGSRQ
jgi:uncharacterized membrane protein